MPYHAFYATRRLPERRPLDPPLTLFAKRGPHPSPHRCVAVTRWVHGINTWWCRTLSFSVSRYWCYWCCSCRHGVIIWNYHDCALHMLLLLQWQRGLPCRHLRGRIAVVCPIRLRINRRLPPRRKCLRRWVSHHHPSHVCVSVRRSSPRTLPRANVVIARVHTVHGLGPPGREESSSDFREPLFVALSSTLMPRAFGGPSGMLEAHAVAQRA